MSSRTRGGDTETLSWDVEGELSSVSGAGGANTTSFVYGADGDRLIKHDPDGATLYLGGDEVRWNKPSDTVTSTRYYQFNGATVAMRTGAQVQLFLSDNHGSATVSVDRSTLAVSRRWLDPFGIPRGQYSGWAPMIRGFVGGQVDTSTDLTHLGAREYDPSLGRFISVDPLADVTNPQQLNAYSYASNNPVTASDPDGMMEKIEKSYGETAPNRNDPPPPADPDPPKKTNPLKRIGSVYHKVDNAVGDAESWLGHAAVDKTREFIDYKMKHGDNWLSDYVADQVVDTVTNVVSNCATAVTLNPARCKMAAGEVALWFVPGVGPELGAATKAILSPLERAAIRRAEQEAAEAAAAKLTAKEAAEAAAKGCNSFVPGTLVLMADGTSKPIEKLKLGDRVLATNPGTGKTSIQPVVATITGQGEKNLISCNYHRPR
jgi:RHS repeat-associated protein